MSSDSYQGPEWGSADEAFADRASLRAHWHRHHKERAEALRHKLGHKMRAEALRAQARAEFAGFGEFGPGDREFRGPRFGPGRRGGGRGFGGPGGPGGPGFGGPEGPGFPPGFGERGGPFGGFGGFGPGGFGPGGFGPGGPGRRGGRGGGRGRRPRGNVRAAVLALLNEEPRHGYAIMTELTERSGGLWRPSPGSVYPVLQQLQDEGLVTAQEAEGRKVFSITDEGRNVIERNPAEFAEPWSVAGPGPRERLQGLMQGLAGVAGATKQVARLGTPEQVDAARKALDDARRALYLILAEAGAEAPVSDVEDDADEDELDD